ncbi:MAG: addiction module antidote protein, HigA family [Deltaproteobacteria bacterium]|nr:MAG: addiction module antidote protein, HigA family [Deltaproteobacteria bacterium]
MPLIWKLLITTRDKIMGTKLTPITPGDVLLEEFLKPMNITQNQLAKDINVPANRISQIIHGKREITADTALRLGKYFGIEPEFWLNLQVRYNMKIAKSKVGKIIEKEVKYHFAHALPHNQAVR